MSLGQHSQYLESRILTAPPQRLHLMLIEGAIRFGRQAEEALLRGDAEAAAPSLLRMLDIVGELLAGVREKKTELNLKLADLYWFVFRRVSLAKINSDATMLAEVLQILEFERETWQMVCDKMESESRTTATPIPAPRSFVPQTTQSGFALEA